MLNFCGVRLHLHLDGFAEHTDTYDFLLQPRYVHGYVYAHVSLPVGASGDCLMR
jgi:hypothetical protein